MYIVLFYQLVRKGSPGVLPILLSIEFASDDKKIAPVFNHQKS